MCIFMNWVCILKSINKGYDANGTVLFLCGTFCLDTL